MALTKEEQRRQQEKLLAEADRLYEQYGKPLERDHWGEYVAISPDGGVLLGQDRRSLTRDAIKAFGNGSFIFKVGPRVVTKWV